MAKQYKKVLASSTMMIIAAVAVMVLILILTTQNKTPQVTPEVSTEEVPIRNDDELTEAEAELDSSDIDEVDPQLEELDSESSQI